MKRPQFGIRLMLLIVALFATVFAWRRAESILKLETERINLESDLRFLEQFTKEVDTSQMSRDYDAEMQAMRNRLAAIVLAPVIKQSTHHCGPIGVAPGTD
jgi:hypothetical protein